MGDHDQIWKVRTDEGGDFTSHAIICVCTRHRIKHEITTNRFTTFNRDPECKLRVMEMISNAVHVEVPLLFPSVEIPTRDELWPDEASWATDSLNCPAAIANPDRVSPKTGQGDAPPSTMLSFLMLCSHMVK